LIAPDDAAVHKRTGLRHWGTDDYRPNPQMLGARAKRSLMDSALREGRLGVAPDALHHGHQAI
jgi:hypothetical protein